MRRIVIKKLEAFFGHRDCVYTLQPSSKDEIFFSGGGDGMIVKWNHQHPDQGELVVKLPNSVYALHYHQQSNVLVAGRNSEGIHLLEWDNKKEIGSLHMTEAAIFDIQSKNGRL